MASLVTARQVIANMIQNNSSIRKRIMWRSTARRYVGSSAINDNRAHVVRLFFFFLPTHRPSPPRPVRTSSLVRSSRQQCAVFRIADPRVVVPPSPPREHFFE